MPDGSIWVLKRNRKEPGYVLTHFQDAQRSAVLSTEVFGERRSAVNAMAAAIGLDERL
jgi:hypothetical protein